MTNHSQAQLDSLKQVLKDRKEKNKSLVEKVHRTTSLLNTLMDLLNHGVNFLSYVMTASKPIPILGFVLQMLAIIPQSIATITNPEASTASKILSAGVLTAITALTIAAFAVGVATAAIIGVVTASIATVIQGIDFFGKLTEKMKATKTYKHQQEFEDLIKLGCENFDNMPEGSEFNQDFAIRSVTLSYVSDKRLGEIDEDQRIKKMQFNYYVDSNVDLKNINLDELKDLAKKHTKSPANLLLKELITLEGEKVNILNERMFVNYVMNKKNIEITGEDPAGKAKKLYDLREEQLKELTQKIALINQNSQTPRDPAHLDAILELQKNLGETNKKIDEIIKPIKETKLAHLTGNENLAKSYTNLALSVSGILFSVIALLLIIGTVTAPPFVLPVAVGVGIGMAAFGIMKWAVEKNTEIEDLEHKTKKEEKQDESILNEAINSYQNQQKMELSQIGTSSYSKHMDGILKASSPAINPEPQVNSSLVSQDNSKTSTITKDIPASTLEEDTHSNENSVSSPSGMARP